MMFVDEADFTSFRKRIDSQWDQVLQQHQITLDECSGGLKVSGGNVNPEKGSCYPI